MKWIAPSAAIVGMLLASSAAHAAEDFTVTIPVNDLTCTVKIRSAQVYSEPDGEGMFIVHRGEPFAPDKVYGGRWIHAQVRRDVDGWLDKKDLRCKW